MMISNRLGLPVQLVKAVTSEYDKGDATYSVSDLTKPPKLKYLQSLHDDSIVEDASDRIWMLLGNAIHYVIDRNKDTHEISEERYYMYVDGVKVSGKPDNLMLSNGTLTDWKVTSAWSFLRGVKKEYEEQLQYYKRLLEENKFTVEKLQLVYILRDWSRSEALRNPEYPQNNVVIADIKPRSRTEVDNEMTKRVHALMDATQAVNCTEDERWAKPDTWAVGYEGSSRAVKVFDNEKSALDWHQDALAKNEGLPPSRKKVPYIENRRGISTRCEYYCNVKEFCLQYQQEIKQHVKEEVGQGENS